MNDQLFCQSCAVIHTQPDFLYPSQIAENREILFLPMLQWMQNSCMDAGIGNILLLQPAKVYEAFMQSIAYAKEQGSEHLFLISGLSLLSANTIQEMLQIHLTHQNAVTCCIAAKQDFCCWIRVDQTDSFLNLNVEELSELLNELQKQIAVELYQPRSAEELYSAHTAADFLQLQQIAGQRIIEKHLQNGVLFLSTDGVLISPEVSIAAGTTILPGCILRGNTTIGSGCTIGPNSLIENSIVGNDTVINASQIYRSVVHDHVHMGPFCHIRPGSELEDYVHLGDFVEVKNSHLGEKTHVAHLTYVGDSDVGKRVNFGGGCITVNYNGKYKFRTIIGDDAFIGCNTNLVAPVKLGNRAFTAAGSTITEDVPDDALALARARQSVKEGWVIERRKKWEEEGK